MMKTVRFAETVEEKVEEESEEKAEEISNKIEKQQLASNEDLDLKNAQEINTEKSDESSCEKVLKNEKSKTKENTKNSKTRGKKRKLDSTERLKKKLKQGISEKLEAWTKKLKRRGVVFMSAVPPMMSPMALRDYVEPWGEIVRVYMKPEDEAVARRRKKFNRDTRKRFVEGWIEFADKRVAKAFVHHCHGQTMKGKRKSRFYHDNWCLKYLKGFKWTQLKEEISYQKAIRDKKMAQEMAQVNREAKYYETKAGQTKHILKKLKSEGKTENDLKKRKKAKQVRPVNPDRVSQKDLAKDLHL